MINIFDWLGDFIGGIGDSIGSTFEYLGTEISNAIWDTMLQWFYETIYNAVAEFFNMMGNMGADIFDLLKKNKLHSEQPTQEVTEDE